jgi:hypothetical protein
LVLASATVLAALAFVVLASAFRSLLGADFGLIGLAVLVLHAVTSDERGRHKGGEAGEQDELLHGINLRAGMSVTGHTRTGRPWFGS